MVRPEHVRFMRRALELAARGRGTTSPNPMVGCVIVKDGDVLGEGYHERAGGPHAEIVALIDAGGEAWGADLYVTLEPCRHHGRTPPCTEAIINAAIRRVIYAVDDPNPAAGGGAEALRRAGVKVIEGVLAAQARELNAAFFKAVRTGLPLVACKWAMTLDGKIATRTGDSKWISSNESRDFVHYLRARHDAVLVGIGTVAQDDPELNCRGLHAVKQPLRVVVDPRGELSPKAALFAARPAGPLLVVCKRRARKERRRALAEAGAELLVDPHPERRVPLEWLLRELGRREVRTVFVEGGSRLHASLIEGGLVDEVYVFLAPRILGGKKAVSPVAGEGVELVHEGPTLRGVEIQRIENDFVIHGKLGDWPWLAE